MYSSSCHMLGLQFWISPRIPGRSLACRALCQEANGASLVFPVRKRAPASLCALATVPCCPGYLSLISSAVGDLSSRSVCDLSSPPLHTALGTQEVYNE